MKNYYKLQSGRCVQTQSESCKYMNNLGVCFKCKPGYNLDTQTKQCFQVPPAQAIENCSSYTNLNICSACKQGFVLANGTCVAIASPIANCESENTKQECKECKSGFVLSPDRLSCVKSSVIENCASQSFIQCDSCGAGYIKNQNNYLHTVFNLATTTTQEKYLLRQDQLEDGRVDIQKYTSCQKLVITNCAEQISYDTCGRCLENFYISEDRHNCFPNPKDAIPHCRLYSSETVCRECEANFWVDGSGKCHAVKQIKNCQTYSKEVNQSHCTNCVEGFFLIGFNICVERTILQIENCQVMDPNSERCIQCQNTFILTSDRTKCLQQIDQCARYEESNVLSTTMKCMHCLDGYYLSNQQCNAGSKQNCVQYERTQDRCFRCSNKFYLEDGICKGHDNIPGCQTYHHAVKNVCLDCITESFLFTRQNACVEAQTITHCARYETDGRCRRCQDGYFLKNEECLEIAAAYNCRQMGEEGVCLKCIEEFILENGECRDPLDYLINQCESNSINGFNSYEDQKCNYCAQNSVPYNFKDSFVCVENEYMKFKQGVTALDPDCLAYNKDMNDNYTCVRCSFGKVVLNGACAAACPETLTLYKQLLKPYNNDGDRIYESFSIDMINVCGEKIPHCAIAAPDQNQLDPTNVKYRCVQCQADSIPVIELGGSRRTIKTNFNKVDKEETQFSISPISFHPGQECVPINGENIIVGDLTNSTIDNCSYYIHLGITFGCTRCNIGYSGVSLDVVSNCQVYTNNRYTCKVCNPNYYKASQYECKPV